MQASLIFPRLLIACCLATLLPGCAATPPDARKAASVAPLADTGEIAQAPYRIDMPARWNGDLILLLHGYEPVGVPRTTPMPHNDFANPFLAQGYAFAASAYSTQGWAVADAIVDNEALRKHFIKTHGEPRRTFLVSFSMGSQIALASMEQHPKAYSGALSLCGVNAPPVEVMRDGVLAPLVAFDALFPPAQDSTTEGLADPRDPALLDGDAIEASLAGNESAAAMLSTQFDIPRPLLAGALYLRALVLGELVTRTGGYPLDNREVVYSGFGDDAAFNMRVRRYTGDPAAMKHLADTAPLTGRVRAPVLILHNNNDPTVTTRFGARYLQVAADAGTGHHVAQLPSVGEGHCTFTTEQMSNAFNALVAWVDSGTAPATRQ